MYLNKIMYLQYILKFAQIKLEIISGHLPHRYYNYHFSFCGFFVLEPFNEAIMGQFCCHCFEYIRRKIFFEFLEGYFSILVSVQSNKKFVNVPGFQSKTVASIHDFAFRKSSWIVCVKLIEDLKSWQYFM